MKTDYIDRSSVALDELEDDSEEGINFKIQENYLD